MMAALKRGAFLVAALLSVGVFVFAFYFALLLLPAELSGAFSTYGGACMAPDAGAQMSSGFVPAR